MKRECRNCRYCTPKQGVDFNMPKAVRAYCTRWECPTAPLCVCEEWISIEILSDEEERIFLAAMGREKKLCEEIDKDTSCSHELKLTPVCDSIIRKVKAALWKEAGK